MKTEKSEEKETQVKVEPSSEVKNEKHEKFETHGQSEVQVKIEPDEEKPQTSGFPDFGHRGPGAYTSVASLGRDRSEDIESDDDVAFFTSAFLTMKELKPKEVHARFAVGPDWDASREKEWRSWKENEVYQKTTRSALPKDVKPIQTRWVYTIKDDGSYKSRLTTRGDVETRRDRAAGIEAVPADSPTVSRKALRLFFALTAFFYWHLDSFDIPTAFLQQDKKFYESRRQEIYLVPPKECLEKGDGPDTLWRCIKTPYGMSDAPRSWYLSFSNWIQSIGGEPLPSDPCVYAFRDTTGNLCGHVCIHVDDGVVAGETDFRKWFKTQLVHKWKVTKFVTDEFKFCGLWVKRESDGTITVDQTKYVEMMEPTTATKGRLREMSDRLTADEVKEIQSVAGAGNWVSTNTRPDVAWSMSNLIGELAHTGTVSVLKLANKFVRTLQNTKDARLTFRPLPGKLSELVLHVFSDASWANMAGLKSQSGQLFFLGTSSAPDCFQGNLLHFRSARIKRVCRSTFAAETMSAVDAQDNAIALQTLFEQWTGTQLPIKIYTDCRSLYESLKQIAPTATEKRLEIDLRTLKESIDSGELAVEWIDTHHQLADALTKQMDPSALIYALETGWYILRDEATYICKEETMTAAQRRLQTFLDLSVLPDVYG